METRVWLGTQARYNPLQQYHPGLLRLDGEALRFTGDQGETLATRLSQAELGFPLSMTGTGFALTVQGRKMYVWFYDPGGQRDALIGGGDENEAAIVGAKGMWQGRKAAKPWLKTLRASRR